MADLSQFEIERIATTAATTAVHETLRVLGIDVNDAFAMQRDFAHLRFWRKIFEGVLGKVMTFGMLAMLAIGTWIAVFVTLKGH